MITNANNFGESHSLNPWKKLFKKALVTIFSYYLFDTTNHAYTESLVFFNSKTFLILMPLSPVSNMKHILVKQQKYVSKYLLSW